MTKRNNEKPEMASSPDKSFLQRIWDKLFPDGLSDSPIDQVYELKDQLNGINTELVRLESKISNGKNGGISPEFLAELEKERQKLQALKDQIISRIRTILATDEIDKIAKRREDMLSSMNSKKS